MHQDIWCQFSKWFTKLMHCETILNFKSASLQVYGFHSLVLSSTEYSSYSSSSIVTCTVIYSTEKQERKNISQAGIKHDLCVNIVGKYKVVEIWPGQTVTCLHTDRPGHIWTTLYIPTYTEFIQAHWKALSAPLLKCNIKKLLSAKALVDTELFPERCTCFQNSHTAPMYLSTTLRSVWTSESEGKWCNPQL